MQLSDANSIKDLARVLRVEHRLLTKLLYKSTDDEKYTIFHIPKKSGGDRTICAPTSELKSVQRKLARLINKKYDELNKRNKNFAHGFIKGKSILTNARVHCNKRYVVNIDLENFFDSFHFGRVRGYFIKNKDFQLDPKIATAIAQLTCYKGRLPQGAPTSPIITNLICEILDLRIYKIAKKYHLNYTRYADDITFSTNDYKFRANFHKFYSKLSKEIVKCGFKINASKTRFIEKSMRQEVTGVVVNKKLNVQRDYYKATRAMANDLYTSGNFMIDGKKGDIRQLEGRFAYIYQFDRYNSIKSKIKRKKFFNNHLGDYGKFLFYKYFWNTDKATIITEGKTDIRYLRAALNALKNQFPLLIDQDTTGKSKYSIRFLNRKKSILLDTLGLVSNGADGLSKYYDLYLDKFSNNNGLKGLARYFKNKNCLCSQNPIFLLFDREFDSEKPLGKFLKGLKLPKAKAAIIEEIKKKCYYHLADNLYLLTLPVPQVNSKSTHNFDKDNFAIEYLFKKVRDGKIKLSESRSNDSATTSQVRSCSKNSFSLYVSRHYYEIDFSDFIPLFEAISEVISNSRE